MSANKPVITEDHAGMITISLPCRAGVLHADIETIDQTPYNSIYIRFTPLAKEESIDIACARSDNESLDVEIKLWSNPSTENPTVETVIRRSAIEEAMPPRII